MVFAGEKIPLGLRTRNPAACHKENKKDGENLHISARENSVIYLPSSAPTINPRFCTSARDTSQCLLLDGFSSRHETLVSGDPSMDAPRRSHRSADRMGLCNPDCFFEVLCLNKIESDHRRTIACLIRVIAQCLCVTLENARVEIPPFPNCCRAHARTSSLRFRCSSQSFSCFPDGR
jgi:hypothetical protein